MKRYVYRFLDEHNNIIYIGKTKNLTKRISQHFSNGHLKKSHYEKVKSIEFMVFISEADQHIAEIYLINKYKPIYNSNDKKRDHLTIQLNVCENWQKLENKNMMKVLNADTYPRAKAETADDTIKRLEAEINNLIINLEIERNITDDIQQSATKERIAYQQQIRELKSEVEHFKDEQRDTINF